MRLEEVKAPEEEDIGNDPIDKSPPEGKVISFKDLKKK
jgi:hypothetical protein